MKPHLSQIFIKICTTILPVLLSFSALAQPANDDICSAVSLVVDGNNCTGGTNVLATTLVADPIGSTWVGGSKSHTVWYKFVAPSSGNITVTTDHTGGGTLTDPQLAIYSSSDGSCSGTLTEIGSNDDINSPSNTQSAVTATGLTPGTTYFVELDGYSNNTGTFCLDVHDGGAVLVNDACTNAMWLWVGSSCNLQNECTYTNFPTQTSATSEAWETAPACWSQGTTLNTVWFKFIAVATTTTLAVEANGGPDPHAAVYSGTCGSLTLLACQEDLASGGGASSSNRGVSISFTTVIGTTYYIQYDSNTLIGCNRLCLSSASGGKSAPSNDACGSAVALGTDVPVTGNTWLGSADGGFSCGTVENSVWYKYTPSISGNYNFSIRNQTGCTSFNNSGATHTNFFATGVQMSIFNTSSCTPTSANELNCSSNLNINDITLGASLTLGNTYLILVDGFGNAGCQFTITASNTGSGSLPVELLYFDGKNEGVYNVLSWQSASEINNDFFSVERKNSNHDFEEIGKVQAKDNGGAKYSFADENPPEGMNYYRLTQTDLDGKKSFPSGIIHIENHMNHDSFKVFPNPGTGEFINLYFDSKPEDILEIFISKMNGNQVFSRKFSTRSNPSSSFSFSVDTPLPSGIYLLKCVNGSKVYFRKLIVQDSISI